MSEQILVEALLRYGPIGLVLIAIAVGWLYTKPHVDDLRATLEGCRTDLREARDEIRRDREIMQEILVPAVTKATELIQRVSEEMWRGRAA